MGNLKKLKKKSKSQFPSAPKFLLILIQVPRVGIGWGGGGGTFPSPPILPFAKKIRKRVRENRRKYIKMKKS